MSNNNFNTNNTNSLNFVILEIIDYRDLSFRI